jgi:glycosyltransferase involved in cell wall biosynthesis
VIRYIPNGVDLQHFTPVRRVRESGSELTVATVGQLRREKNQELLIQACAELHRRMPVRLLIAGEGPERTKLQETARSLGFDAQVTFLGQVSDIGSVLQQADIFALSSLTEQMPLSVLEAMACGLPVLSTAVGDVKHMVSAENRPYVCDPREYPSALQELAADAPRRLALGAANHTRCKETYSLDTMLEAYQRLYLSSLTRSLKT